MGQMDEGKTGKSVWRTAYRIDTNRLRLRCLAPTDAEPLAEAVANSDGRLARFIDVAAGATRADVVARIRRWRAQFDQDLDYFFAVEDRYTDEVLGGFRLTPALAPDSWTLGGWLADGLRGGLAFEAAAVLVRLAFHLGARRVELCCPAQQTPKIAAALGFARDEQGRLARSADAAAPVPDTVPFRAYDAAGERLGSFVVPPTPGPDWQALIRSTIAAAQSRHPLVDALTADEVC